jgi:hypothetical protein
MCLILATVHAFQRISRCKICTIWWIMRLNGDDFPDTLNPMLNKFTRLHARSYID